MEIIFWSICKELVIVIALISLTIVGYFYACILLKARQVRSQISSYNKREGNSIKNRAKAAWTSLIILFTFLICYRPVTAYLVFEIVTGNNVTTWSETYLELSANIIAMSNTLMNPLVYYWRMHFAREAICNLLRSFSCGRKIKQPRTKISTTSSVATITETQL